MVTFRNKNNQRRNNFRRSDRSFKINGERSKFGANFSNNESFQRKIPGRNNHNAPKLIEKYNNLAREALSSGDKILSENYFQHADHFTRVCNDQESFKKSNNSREALSNSKILVDEDKKTENLKENENSEEFQTDIKAN